MFFLIPPNSAFHGLLEEFLFPSVKIQNFYHINNQFVIKISTFYDSATIIWRIIGKIPLLEVASNCMLNARTIGRRIANVQSHIFNFCTFSYCKVTK